MSAAPGGPGPFVPDLEPALKVGDPRRSLHFYVEGLGFEPYGEVALPTRHLWGLRLGTSVLKLIFDAEPAPPGDGLAGSVVGFSHLSVRVPDARAVVQRLRAAGYQAADPQPFPPAIGRAGFYGFLEDPDGNRIELLEGSAWDVPGEAFMAGQEADLWGTGTPHTGAG
jgi:catechol 2,3-dioxygenase-like lactoylglutathione lyase family enzyme